MTTDGVCGLCWHSTLTRWRYTPALPNPPFVNGSPPCDLYSKVSELEKAIEDTQKTLFRLVNEHKDLVFEVNKYHDPMQNLPVEIISHIFSLCFTYQAPSSYTRIQNSIHNSRKELPLMLGKICRRWRQIAWSTPKLWSNIYVYSRKQTHISMVSEWICRSGQLPLSIRVSMKDEPTLDGHPLVNITRSLSGRWRNLELYANRVAVSHIFADGYDVPLQRLKYLGIQIIDQPDWESEMESPSYSLPDADRLVLDRFNVNVNQISWLETKCLELCNIGANETVDLLYYAQNIRTLAVPRSFWTEGNPMHSTPIAFPHLISIDLAFNVGILDYISAPALEVLAMASFPSAAKMTQFLSQWPRLQELRLEGAIRKQFAPGQRLAVLQHLQLFQDIVTLVVENEWPLESNTTFVDDLFLQYLDHRSYTLPDSSVASPFLPCVEHLSFEGRRLFAWASILPLFGSGHDDNYTRKRLKTLVLKIESEDPEQEVCSIDLETARKLRELEPGVLSISVISPFSGDTLIEDLVQSSCKVVRLLDAGGDEDTKDSSEDYVCGSDDGQVED